jgi:hypothetical protein
VRRRAALRVSKEELSGEAMEEICFNPETLNPSKTQEW